MQIVTTRIGLRLSQHGVVISELRTSPGPTHSVFDVLAALIAVLQPGGRVGVLGFAGGGMMAPLRGLGVETRIDSVDLDPAGYNLFRRHCPEWVGHVRWQQSDALAWLKRQAPDFGLLMDDLSISHQGDVVKPLICWSTLPELMQRRLLPGGVAIFNLMLPRGGRWNPDLKRLADRFKTARVVLFD